MESETKQAYPCINGLSKPPSESQMMEKKKGNFLLLKDPFLDDKVQKKVYRYDGLMPGGQTVDLKDPRRRSYQRSNPRYRLSPSRQVMDLDVPRFKYDQNYVGTPPPNEVTFTNLNDNIDKKFLENMCRQFGSIEEIKIYHHPKTKKHMGIGKVLFTFSKCAKACVDKLHQTSKMGNIINVMIDTMGKERSRIIEEMLADKPKNARRLVPPPERIDPRSHGRLYTAASTSSNRSVASCNFIPTKSKYNDYGLEAYDPGDTEFDFGNAGGHRQMVNTSIENTSYSDSDYGSLQHCDSGYSVPQSEMSFSGHSDISSSSYDSYNQYSSQHASGNRGWSCTPHAASYSSYGVQQQYGQHNSGRQVNASYSQQQHYSHSNYDAGHQTCPPPEPTTQSHAESSSRSHSYSERRDEYKERSTPSFPQHHWEKERERETNNREKCREKEHRIRPKTPEPEEPRNQSLESRLQSIFGLGGLGSPTESNRSKDHSSPSSTPRSRDEICTPSPGVDSRYSSSQQYPVSSRASSSGSCSSHVIQMPPLPPDNDEETKLPPTPTPKSDSSDRPDYSREPSSRSKRFEFKNSVDHSDNISHYDQLKTDKVTPAIPSSSSVSSTSRYKSESNDDNCSNGLLGAASRDFPSKPQQTKSFAASVAPLPKHLPVEETIEKENNVDMEIDDDDDDRMSLSSISSGEEKLEVNVQLPNSDGKFTTNNFQSISSSQTSRTAPPVPLITDFSRPPPGMQPWSFSSTYSFGNYPTTPRMDLTTGTFNQSYCSQIPGSLVPMNYAGQSLTDSTLSQATGTTVRGSEDRQQEEVQEEKDPNDKTFLFVLDHFVRELKEVMQKDLCKKMIENSAFKSFELWWDTEEQKSKFQKGSGPNDKAAINKDASVKSSQTAVTQQQPTTQLTPGRNDVNSTLASLFETQHPWRQEGGFEAHYGGAHGGGFLGIRGVMPRMPSFKKKVFRPPSPPPPDDEDSKAAESLASNAEDESDDDVVGSSPSIRKKNVYASDEESASEDEKSYATASEDEDGSDESSEEESDEEASDETSDTSEEGSEEEEEEDEEESEAKSKNESESTSANGLVSISSDSEKILSTHEKDQTSVEESPLETETRKIQDESSSESESEVESEKDTAESSSDAEPDQTVLFKPQLSPIKEEEEQDEVNKEDKVHINEKPSVSNEYEMQERTELPDSNNKTSTTCTVSADTSKLQADISSDDQTFSSSESKKTSGASAQVSSAEDNDESKQTTTTTITDEEVPSTEISSEVTTTSDEESSKTDRSKAHVIPAIAEHDYVAMPPPLPVSLEIKSYEESDHIEEHEMEVEEEEEDDYDDSDRTESCDEDNTALEILIDHNYCLPPAIGEVHEDSELCVGWAKNKIMSEDSLKDTAANAAVQDVVQKLAKGNLTADEHAAAATAAVVAAAAATVSASQAAAAADDDLRSTKKKKKRVKDSTLTDITNKSVNEHEAEVVKPIVKPKIQFQPRGYQEEKQLFFDIYNKGIDQEDINYLKRTYETLLQSEDPMYDWLNDIFWVDHTHTDIPDPVPPKKKRKVDEQITPIHKTGSARTEGFYKISKREKAGYLCHVNKAAETGQQNEKKLSMTSREARHNIRRFQTNFGDLELGELFKFNQLKFRKKQLRFAKSSIHDWGLFALEPIAAEEMVIEYVGQVIRHFVADEREKQYGAQGIGSSYLFRVDNETIIDATKAGNLARFINHSCNPNCYAKIITVEAHKKIVIYSKRDIDVNEEITYDYKFPLEEEKISCLCGAQGCKGTLN